MARRGYRSRVDLGTDATLAGEHHQGTLGRIADQLPVAGDRVRGQHHGQQELLEVLIVEVATFVEDGAGRAVARAADLVATAHRGHLDGGHLVEGEGAGLVGVDGRGRAQRLHRTQVLDDGARLRQRARTHRQDGRDHRRQAGRDGRDREGDGRHEELIEGLAPQQAQEHRGDEGGAGDGDQLAGQLGQLLGERSDGLVSAREQVGDVADLGLHAGGGDHEGRRATRHAGVHEDHVDAIAQRRLGIRQRGYVLGNRQGFAGEGRLVHLEGGGGDETPVGGNEVAGLDRDDVARHQLLRRHLHQLAPALDARPDDHHLLERCHRGRSLALLGHAHGRVEHGQPDEHQAGGVLLHGPDADDAGHQQDDLHEVLVLAQEDLPAGLLLAFRELVRAVLVTPGGDLAGRETGLGVYICLGEGFLGSEQEWGSLAGVGCDSHGLDLRSSVGGLAQRRLRPRAHGTRQRGGSITRHE